MAKIIKDPNRRSATVQPATSKPIIAGVKEDEALAFARELWKESDRGVALMVIAQVDRIMDLRLKQIFSHGNRDAQDHLFRMGTGPLGSFFNKVSTLFCLGIIPERIYKDVSLVNKLRNKCAHDWMTFKFNKTVYDKYIVPLLAHATISAYNEELVKLGHPPALHQEQSYRELCIRMLSVFLSLVNHMCAIGITIKHYEPEGEIGAKNAPNQHQADSVQGNESSGTAG